jgi:hypothetical protein
MDIYKVIETFFPVISRNNGEWIKNAIFILASINLISLFYWFILNFKNSDKKSFKFFIPENFFISLGILGTFVGIADAFKPGMKIDTQTVNTLIGGMSTAFHTSIYGVVITLIHSIVRHWLNLRIIQKEKRNELYYLKIIASSSQIESNQKIQEAVATLANGLMAFEKFSQNVDPDKTADKIARAVSTTMDPFFKSLETKMSVIDQLYVATKELKEVNSQLAIFIQKDLRSIFDSLRISVEGSNESIRETNNALNLTKKSLEQQRDNLSGLESTLNNFSKNLDIVFEKQLGLLKETGEISGSLINTSADKLKAAISGVGDSLNQMRKETFSQLENFQSEYKKGLSHFLETQGEHLDKHLKANAEKLSETVQ